jgi:chaperonin GroEL
MLSLSRPRRLATDAGYARGYCYLTGGQVITEADSIEDATSRCLVKLKIATKDNTTVVEGKGSEAQIKERTAQIRAQIAETTSDYELEKLQERVAKLEAGVAVIKVGAATEVELKEKKLRIEDAINSTKAAVAEGIVPGGGAALAKISRRLENVKTTDAEEAVGVKIVAKALEAPLRQIAANAGISDIAVILEAVSKADSMGWDFAKNEQVDMLKAGIMAQ